MIGVIAGNAKQFDDFLRNMHMGDRKNFTYLHSPHQAVGYNLSAVIRIGTYYENHQYHAIYDTAMNRVRP